MQAMYAMRNSTKRKRSKYLGWRSWGWEDVQKHLYTSFCGRVKVYRSLGSLSSFSVSHWDRMDKAVTKYLFAQCIKCAEFIVVVMRCRDMFVWGIVRKMSFSIVGVVLVEREGERKQFDVWFQVRPFASVKVSVPVVRSKYFISPFSSALHWPEHRFYINRFHRL